MVLCIDRYEWNSRLMIGFDRRLPPAGRNSHVASAAATGPVLLDRPLGMDENRDRGCHRLARSGFGLEVHPSWSRASGDGGRGSAMVERDGAVELGGIRLLPGRRALKLGLVAVAFSSRTSYRDTQD